MDEVWHYDTAQPATPQGTLEEMTDLNPALTDDSIA